MASVLLGSQSVSAQDTIQLILSTLDAPHGSLGSRKEVILKRRVKRAEKQEVVLKGYYQEVIGITTYMDPPQPLYGRKKRFRRVESTNGDKGFRRKFGI